MGRQHAYGGAFVAAIVAVLLGASSLTTPPRARPSSSAAATYEEAIEVPPDWASMPIAATLDVATMGNRASVTTVAPLDDVYVEYTRSECFWGGSACAHSPATLSDVRFGGLDRTQAPRWGLPYQCESLDPRNACRRDFAVRHAGSRYVLTIHDLAGDEKPIGAISRTPARLLVPGPDSAWSLDRGLLAVLAAVSFALGLVTLAEARRFVRLCRWTPTHIGGVAVLVDPRANSGTTAYRDAGPIAEHFVWRGNLGRARQRATSLSRIALALIVASALVSFVALRAYP